jgi:hypothetical protein
MVTDHSNLTITDLSPFSACQILSVILSPEIFMDFLHDLLGSALTRFDLFE